MIDKDILPTLALNDLITEFGNACNDFANELECGGQFEWDHQEQRQAALLAEFRRRGLDVRNPS